MRVHISSIPSRGFHIQITTHDHGEGGVALDVGVDRDGPVLESAPCRELGHSRRDSHRHGASGVEMSAHPRIAVAEEIPVGSTRIMPSSGVERVYPDVQRSSRLIFDDQFDQMSVSVRSRCQSDETGSECPRHDRQPSTTSTKAQQIGAPTSRR